MATPPRLAGERAEGRAGVTILFSQPKYHQNSDSPASGGRKGGGTRGSHHFGIFTAQNHQNGDSPASGGRKGGGTRKSPFWHLHNPKPPKWRLPRVWREKGRRDARESPFWHFHSPEPPKWRLPRVWREKGGSEHGDCSTCVWRERRRSAGITTLPLRTKTILPW